MYTHNSPPTHCRSQFEIDQKELKDGKEKVKEGLQEQLVEKNLPQSGKGAERLSAEDYAERERQLRVSQPAIRARDNIHP